MKVKYGTAKKVSRLLRVLFPAALITMPFIGRLPHVLGLTAIAAFVIVMAITAAWSLAYWFGKLSLICSKCESSMTLKGGRGFRCPRCGLSQSL